MSSAAHPVLPSFRRVPREHQDEALDSLTTELVDHDRATAVMACGTGKTLVALWQAERLNPKRVVVFVPSLALLRQTLLEWAENTSWGKRFRYLCVCSDPKVSEGAGSDDIGSDDIGFPVMTEPSVVGAFLTLAPRPDSVSVVFCTYHSAEIVGQAIKPLGARGGFDVGVFDEAHKTTGDRNGLFGFALKDQNIAIKKRIFFTATPKHYKLGKRDVEGEYAVASMDDAAAYGRVAYCLGFAEAAARKIIVPYRIVISVVDTSMVDNAILEKGQVLLQGVAVDAKTTAHQLAIKHAVDAHSLKRIITFHARIASARNFAAENARGAVSHLPGFETFHVSGAQSAPVREALLQKFADAPLGLISNSRCLTEGVDVPSVDLVVFIDPRRSQVDIAQAAGRSMRRDGAKECGYILIPLLVEPGSGESIDDAVARSDFSAVFDVLNGMREADDDLNATLTGPIASQDSVKDRSGNWMDRHIEVLGPLLNIDVIRSAISTQLIETFGKREVSQSADERWTSMKLQLLDLWATRGRMPMPAPDPDFPLPTDKLLSWVSTQRNLEKNGKLLPWRKEALEEIDFDFDRRVSLWWAMYSQLKDFHAANGHTNVPHTAKGDLKKLADWVSWQRMTFKKNLLQEWREKALLSLEFEFDPQEGNWQRMFRLMKTFASEHGHCNVTESHRDAYPGLPRWVNLQRTESRTGIIDSGHQALLSSIGFSWNPFANRRTEMTAKLLAYFEEFGHSDVPAGYPDKELVRWVASLRRLHWKDTLEQDRRAVLSSINFKYRIREPRPRRSPDRPDRSERPGQ